MKLEIDDTFLKVKLNPLEMIASFHGSLNIPLSRITGVSMFLMFARTEDCTDQIREAKCHIQKLIFPGCLMIGKGCFNQVTGTV